MTTIDKTTLKSKLATAIDNYIYGSTQPSDVLSLALSIQAMNEPNILTVSSVGALPVLELYDSPNAMVVFIEGLYIFAISSNKKWLTLDGRLLRDDTGSSVGTAYAWGRNFPFMLGDGTTVHKSSPVLVAGNITAWSQVDGGQYHSIGIASGAAWTWGCNGYGRLGDGTTVNKSSPISIVGGFTDWCQINASGVHSLGIRTNGTAWAWGRNNYGQLGDGTSVNKSSPVSVVGGFTDWCQVTGGRLHSVGIRTNGTIWSWGYNKNGALGNNTDGFGFSKSSPVSIVGGFTDWCLVRSGSYHNVAVRTNGTLWSWGRNTYGQLGDGTKLNRSSPVSVIGGFTDWCGADAGYRHIIGIRTNGTAWTWGSNIFGLLGDGTTVNKSSPVSVVGGFTDWCQVRAGGYHNLGIRTNGSLWSWGYNGQGRLGDGTTINKSSPVSVIGGYTDWCQISGGRYHSLGLRTS